ncbi:MAG TPA: hypothetical protein PK313_00155 [Myxococcota bacterium]|jgi:hypothetical protein|nr:hypothetical protein [Myxococcota bacterium]
MRIAVFLIALGLAVGGAAGCARNDCHKLADYICNSEGVSAEDCAAAKRQARKSKSDAEKAACTKMYEVFSKMPK